MIYLTALSLLLSLSSHLQTLVGSTSIDCFPQTGASQEKCEALGCVWKPVQEIGNSLQDDGMSFDEAQYNMVDGGRQSKLRINPPWCSYPDNYIGFKVYKRDETNNNYRLERMRPSGFQNDVKDLNLDIESYGSDLLRVKIYDADQRRYETQLPLLNLNQRRHYGKRVASEFRVDIITDSNQANRLVIKRGSTGAVLFDADLSRLVFADQFIQLNSKLDSPYVYGLGQHYGSFLKLANDSYKSYSFYHIDRLALPNGLNSYGSFPFYINVDSPDASKAHGVYLHNSNAMDIILQADQSITFRPIGGILDFIFFSGPTPLDVINQYTHLVGLPSLPPRWALGFHLCRYNYGSLNKTELVWKRTRDTGIPFDVQWNDIDLMDKGNDFTYDHQRFAGMPEFIEKLHSNNMHYMTIFDPGLSREAGYYPYDLGTQLDIFIKNASNQELVAKVWNSSGKTVFPDFSSILTVKFWSELFLRFQEELKVDGAWIDMNDPSNFVYGSLDGCPNDPIERPPYKPGGADLQAKSLCLSARHTAGLEYNVHNLYSFYEAMSTYEALRGARPGKRPFIISRSTRPGQGKFSGHWSGDLLASWDYLRWSIPALIEHSMYGFSMTGSDICGFVGNTNPELCARWSTLGAFYTFTRNHNDDKSIDQDPAALGTVVVEANRNALRKRYSLIPYLYSLLHRAEKFGEPVIRSVVHQFFDTDKETLNLPIEYQFLWGKGLMVSPVVEQSSDSKKTYLPRGRWYETNVLPASNGTLKLPKVIDSKGEWYETKNISLVDIPLFYRGGNIVPVYMKVGQTVPETAREKVAFEVYLCPQNKAYGELFYDDGDSLNDRYDHLTMKFENNHMTVVHDHHSYQSEYQFGQVTIFGVNHDIKSIRVGGEPVEFTRTDHVVSFDLGGFVVSTGRQLTVKLQ